MSTGGATRRLLGAFLGTVLCVAGAAAPAAADFALPFTRDAIDYLKTRGLLPLWAGVTRPILPWNVKAALDVGRVAQRISSLSAPDLAAIRLLDDAFNPSGTERFSAEAAAVAPFGIPKTYGDLSTIMGSSAATVGWAVNSPTATLTAHARDVSWLAGRTPLGWGPAPAGSELLFNQSAGGFDLLQVSFVWSKVHFTKVVGWLDDGRSVVGTRMDIPYRPNLRLGFGESVLMQGSPYLPYALNPIPIGINPPLMSLIRNPQGIYDNFFLTADAEWVPHPGLRLFGELLIDDVTVPMGGIDFPSRWGFTMGFHSVSEHGSGVQALYTMVLNWTYSQTPPYNYLLRGLPLGHTLGNDFDLVYIRWLSAAPPASSIWAAYVRKGEGQVGVFWTSQQEAWQKLWLSGVVEYSVLAGFDSPFSAPGWMGTVGPWVAYRTNADHVPGATRVDWGVNVEAQWSF